MEWQKYLEGIKSVTEADCTASIILIKRIKEDNDHNYEFYKININQEIGNEFKKILNTKITSILKGIQKDNIKIEGYDCSTKTSKHLIEFIESERIKTFQTFYQNISNVNNIEPIKKIDKEFLEFLWCYAIKLENKKGNEIIYLRKYSKSKVITRGDIFACIFDGGTFNKLKQNLFIFDEAIDCMFFNNKLLIFNRYFFEQIFNFLEEFKEHSKILLDNIKQKFKITNFDEFRTQCINDSRIVRKLNNIYNKKYYENMTFETMKEIKKEFNLSIELVEKDGKQEIIYDKKNIWEILNLLDDDYLNSSATKNKYVVESKKDAPS